jgi:hypothetical protein
MLASDILTYQDFLKDTAEPIRIRLAMVKRFKEKSIQTDNGTEFVNTRDATDTHSLFIRVVTRNDQTEHLRIPPGAKTRQSDVESSYRIIEREFYDTVKAHSDANMIIKLRAYQWGFNVMRKNG